MSGTDDLRDLLDRLKDEVGPLPAAKPAASPAMPAAVPAGRELPPARRFVREGFSGQDEPRHSGDTAWRDDREAVFFGLMASLVAALGGVLGGLDYLAAAGTASFAIFSAVMAYGLFARFRGGGAGLTPDLQARLDLLARRVDALASRPSGHSGGSGPRGPADPETERKLEELYALFRSLSKAVGGKA